MKAKASVLIVDDNSTDIGLVSEYLRSAGYTVNAVSDGFKALAASKVKAPDIILLDLTMPLMSGVEVFNRLRIEDKLCFVPVIFMRSVSELSQVTLSKEMEEVPVMMKPLEPADVESLIKTVLREKTLKDELRKKEGQVRELALVDPLTSCRNSRYLSEFLRGELSQCARYNQSFSLLAISVDGFKEIQRTMGSRAIDAILPQLAVILARGNRKADILARTGPGEFILALPFTLGDGAIEVAERIRANVNQSTFSACDKTTALTVSIGISQFNKDMDTEGNMLLSYARAAMGQAQDSGGNNTFMAE